MWNSVSLASFVHPFLAVCTCLGWYLRLQVRLPWLLGATGQGCRVTYTKADGRNQLTSAGAASHPRKLPGRALITKASRPVPIDLMMILESSSPAEDALVELNYHQSKLLGSLRALGGFG